MRSVELRELASRTQRCSPVHRIGPTITEHRAAVFESSDFSSGAVHVVERLQDQGFEAYVVGGAVRDLCWAKNRRTLMSPPTPRPSKSNSAFAVRVLSAAAFKSFMYGLAGRLSR